MKISTIMLFALANLALSLTVNAQSNKPKTKKQTARVIVNERGYQPASLKLRRSVPAKITFLRTTDATCGTEVVISAYGINRNLPLNQAVVVSFTPKKTGEFTFTCGMNMMRGKLIVQ